MTSRTRRTLHPSKLGSHKLSPRKPIDKQVSELKTLTQMLFVQQTILEPSLRNRMLQLKGRAATIERIGYALKSLTSDYRRLVRLNLSETSGTPRASRRGTKTNCGPKSKTRRATTKMKPAPTRSKTRPSLSRILRDTKMPTTPYPNWES